MGIGTFIAVYFLIWWLVLFTVLPWGARSQRESGEVAAGTDPGAPANHRVWRVAAMDHDHRHGGVRRAVGDLCRRADPVRLADGDFRPAAALLRERSSKKKEQGARALLVLSCPIPRLF